MFFGSSEFVMCKMGCSLPDFQEFWLGSFRDGQTFLKKKIKRATNVLPPSEVTMICGDTSERDFISKEFQVGITPVEKLDAVFVVEILQKEEDANGTLIERIIGVEYSLLRQFSLNLDRPASISFYKLRVTTVSTRGVSALQTHSPWFSSLQLFPATSSKLQPILRRQHFVDGAVSAVFGWVSRDLSLPTCSLTVEWNLFALCRKQSFSMDWSRSFAISGLDFSQKYTVFIYPSFEKQKKTEHKPFQFFTKSCYTVSKNYTQCPPLPVSNITWQDVAFGEVFLSWEYSTYHGLSKYNFTVALRPLADYQRPECQPQNTLHFNIPAKRTSIVLNSAKPRCDYEIVITVADTNGRFSAPTYFTKFRRVNEIHEIPVLQILLIVAVVAGWCCVVLLI